MEYRDFGCAEIIIIVNSIFLYEYKKAGYTFLDKIQCVLNQYTELERFYSIQLGLKAINANCSVFIQNIDNPFVSSSILSGIYNYRERKTVVIPQYNDKGGHPVLIGGDIVNEILKEDLKENFKNVISKYKQVFVDIDNEDLLININTAEQYQEYFKKIL